MAASVGTAPPIRRQVSDAQATPTAPDGTPVLDVAEPTPRPAGPAPGETPIIAPPPIPTRPASSPEDQPVRDAMAALASDEARVGQLLMLGWAGNTAEQARQTLRELQPGGIVFVDNTRSSAEAAAINAALPRIAAEYGVLVPLIAVDHEGGLVQRIADVPNLGSNLDFGSRRPTDAEACARGSSHAQQLRAMRFSMNLAPVLDVNNNPNNPVIGSRSFGPDPELVARLGSAYVRGLQSGGIVAVGKHFPGHGNTSVDSHLQLPVLPQTEAELEDVELVPFRRVALPGTDIAAIMSAHIVFPAVDPSRAPATLSAPIMTGLLREKLGFQGLVLSDDLAGMKAITDNFPPGEAAVRAVRAGVDMLIVAGGIARQRESRDAILAALEAGELSRDRVDEAVRHVLTVKARFGLIGGPASTGAGCP